MLKFFRFSLIGLSLSVALFPVVSSASITQLTAEDGAYKFADISQRQPDVNLASRGTIRNEEFAAAGLKGFEFHPYDTSIETGNSPAIDKVYFILDDKYDLPGLAAKLKLNNIYPAGGGVEDNLPIREQVTKWGALTTSEFYPLYKKFLNEAKYEKDPIMQQAEYGVLSDVLNLVQILIAVNGLGLYSGKAYEWGLPIEPDAARIEFERRVETRENLIKSSRGIVNQ
ncbi:MAG: hypothetical protein K0S08_1684 [Gammaproteobacteria bacterium]|nr:hypothetical protein [Gammaproteobacteria bacterium]